MATLTQTENQIRPLYIDGYTHQLSYAPGGRNCVSYFNECGEPFT